MKKFLVQIEDSPSTRWFATDAELCEWLHLPIRGAVHGVTSGPAPKITVTTEEEAAAPIEIKRAPMPA